MLEQCWNKPIRQVRNEIGKMSCLAIVLVLCNFWIVSIAVSLSQKQAQQTPSTGAGWNGGTADLQNSLQVVVVIENMEGISNLLSILTLPQFWNTTKHHPILNATSLTFTATSILRQLWTGVGLGMSTGPRLQKQSLELARRHWEGLAHEKNWPPKVMVDEVRWR